VDRLATGKYYWEVTSTTAHNGTFFGVASANAALSGATTAWTAAVNCSSGSIQVNTIIQTGIGVISSGGKVCIAIDLTAQLIWFRNGAAGNWNGNASGNPATGVGGYSLVTIGGVGIPLYASVGCNGTGAVVTANFGDTAFTGAVPAGFTSGFTSGLALDTNVLATQVALEEWGVGPSVMQVTQVAVEEFGSTAAPIWVTQAALEHWYTTGNPPLWVTQAAIEHWGSVQATYPVPANPTFVLSGSRAGIGSVVVRL
jgi:hypothetical protein